ncbi:protein phosphatase, putative [Ichthyophthirius multifiliis]|uniref:protein-serine/threonine phosphatase n=1 Tax=Ichthyophthirius multifiliis TaxID=5932 RepID=G0QNP7_ICHMU|nr:protein phosphatase, putative [Ichthyophthirius multifiliis]EGR33166.1 protein phosphatase, putative [Ichthyophthirius multifiliis]|eukprot:XP_004037152.1 protein phosphatase, putative [Ichthyophthirius multifiliis]
MGPYMSQPKTDKKIIADQQNGYLKFAMVDMQGWRNTMEDGHISDINVDEETSIFGIFDGHGGHEVAKFGKAELIKLKNNKINDQNNHNNDYDEDSVVYAGCTANVALIHKKQLYVANSGDSRTVIYNKGNPIEMSIDHKPDNPDEKQRITKAGGFVSDGRVNGNLNLSRAFGDFEYKKGQNGCRPHDYIITAFPEVKTKQLTNDDKFMLMGCDGIWECMNNQDLGKFCQSRIEKNMSLKDILVDLLDTILAKDTASNFFFFKLILILDGVGCDNMTAILVQFK